VSWQLFEGTYARRLLHQRLDGTVAIVVDVVHVLEYLWRAAWVRHEAPPYRAG